MQTDVEYRIGSFWRVSGAYLYDQAKVTDGGVANAALVGKYLPQVPMHRGSFQVAYSNPQLRERSPSPMQALSLQYNDDQNVKFIPVATLAEAGYDLVHRPRAAGVRVGRSHASCATSGRNVQVFFGVQNMFDQVSFVQTNPSTTGTPRLVNVGVRVRLSGR